MTKPTPKAISHGIGLYLDELEAGGNGSGPISLGPRGVTSDPKAIDAFADELEERFAATSSNIARLRLRQKILNLRAAADARRDGAPHARRDFFVKYAADWAIENGIGYAAFRDLGVPAAVLKEAGIDRSS